MEMKTKTLKNEEYRFEETEDGIIFHDYSCPKYVRNRDTGSTRREKINTCHIKAEEITMFGKLHAPWTDLGYYYGVAPKILQYHFEPAYRKGQTMTRMGLRKKMLSIAMEGNVTMIIWCAKNMLGMSDLGPMEGEQEQLNEFEGFTINE